MGLSCSDRPSRAARKLNKMEQESLKLGVTSVLFRYLHTCEIASVVSGSVRPHGL